jgi:hypothetical protein
VVGVAEAVASLVAVATLDVGSSVAVADGTGLLAVGVSVITTGGSVGSWVGSGFVGWLAVGVLVAPVGVAVGMVWFRLLALAVPHSGAPQAVSLIASVTSKARITTRRLTPSTLIFPLPP